MKYTARIYYSTYCEYEVEAENECEAIEKAQNLKINEAEIIKNLEIWNEANEAECVEKQ